MEKEKNTAMAIIAYIIFFIPLLTEDKKDPFVLFHVKQGLALFILSVVSSFIPVIGWFIGYPLSVILFVIGILNASKGLEKELPVIGVYAKKINL